MARKSITDLLEMKNRAEKIAMVTCYDATFAKIADQTAIDTILVGDSMGNVMLGFENTLPVKSDDIIRSCAAVVRATSNPFIVADLPFLSYHVSIEQAVENAGRLVQEGGAQAVKLEGGKEFAEVIKAIVRAQIPVVAHLGLTPQSVNVFGGFKVQAKTKSAQETLCEDALAVQEAGASLLVLEGVPREIAKTITDQLSIPTIGIGAGPDCSGQVLVLQDLLGMTENVPKFVKKFANLQREIADAFNEYAKEVKAVNFPNDSYSFHTVND